MPSTSKWLSLQQSAERVGHFVWLERRLFSVLGAWVVSTPEVELKRFFADNSFKHAWHAQLWEDRLPVLREVNPALLVVPAKVELAEAINELEVETSSSARLSGFYRVVLPHLISAYRAWQRGCSPVSDAAVSRTLKLCLNDLLEDWVEGEDLTQMALLSWDSTAEMMANLDASNASRGALEAKFCAFGGILSHPS